MRRVLTLVIIAVAAMVVVAPANAAESGNAPHDATAWLASKVQADGSLEDPYNPGNPSYGLTAQAVLALAGNGQAGDTIARMQTFLAAHVDDYVSPGGNDRPAELAILILGARATGLDPEDFGGEDLVARLRAIQRPDGLYGLAPVDPTYDGVFRQSLALIALHAVGVDDATGLAWLEAQQCADGSFVSYRPDTSVPCPPLDLTTFTGPDTNSTALGAMALDLLGADADSAMTWLRSVRTADGGFTYFGDPSGVTDANSTGIVAAAFTTVGGTPDAQAVAALRTLQVSCASPIAEDRGGIAFQPQDGNLFPDASATIQALWGLSGRAFPFLGVDITPGYVEVCAAPVTTSTVPSAPTSSTTPAEGLPATTATSTPGDQAPLPVDYELPRTGGSILGMDDGTVALVGLLLVASGVITLTATRRRTSTGR